jgi:dethiobiotin synthase
MSPHGFFVTGTDTNVGKTWISRLLCDTFAESRTVSYCKPVQTGCSGQSGNLQAPDFDFVMQGRARQVASYDVHVPYRFLPACSPHLAAAMAQTSISVDHVAGCVNTVANLCDCVIVEGAGGVAVPIDDTRNMLDLMVACRLPVILVTTPKLGTLNHTFLSIMALRQHALTLAGVVFNNSGNAEKDAIYTDNYRTIARSVAPVPVFDAGYNQPVGPAIMEFCHGLAKQFL